MCKKTVSIAIDGPSGVGKSTIAKLLSEELGYLYIDTGAMFRTLAVYFFDNGLSPSDETGIVASLNNVEVGIRHIDGVQHMFANGADVTSRLRTQEVSNMASVSSQYGAVRAKLLEIQREIAAKENVIMDGRDIGTVVLPDATLKIFLTATSEVKAMRRFKQLEESGQLNGASYESILKDQEERDYRDSHRSIAPLKAADDAVTVDTSDMTIEEVKSAIIAELNKMLV